VSIIPDLTRTQRQKESGMHEAAARRNEDDTAKNLCQNVVGQKGKMIKGHCRRAQVRRRSWRGADGQQEDRQEQGKGQAAPSQQLSFKLDSGKGGLLLAWAIGPTIVCQSRVE
jgi:hypothetical protein